MAILRDRKLDEMEATRFRIQSMLQGRNKIGYEIMNGVRRATKIDKMEFKSSWDLHQASRRYENRKNREKNVKSKARTKAELLARIDEMEKQRATVLDVLNNIMDKMDRMAALNKKLTATVKAYKEHNVKFAMFAMKHQDCEDSAKCVHGAAVKEIITDSDWINLQKENKRKRKRKTEKTDDQTSPSKKSKRDNNTKFQSKKEKSTNTIIKLSLKG